MMYNQFNKHILTRSKIHLASLARREDQRANGKIKINPKLIRHTVRACAYGYGIIIIIIFFQTARRRVLLLQILFDSHEPDWAYNPKLVKCLSVRVINNVSCTFKYYNKYPYEQVCAASFHVHNNK